MIIFFKASAKIYAVESSASFAVHDIEKLIWLFGAKPLQDFELVGFYSGPRKEMITPWSTNAVEITQNMGIQNIRRIEEFFEVNDAGAPHDKMLQVIYTGLNQDIFTIRLAPEPVLEIDDIAAYNNKEGLALSEEEIDFLKEVSDELGRKLTDSEVFGFSQVNSEHCRHKIFNGRFILNGAEQEPSLFQLIKKTAKTNPNFLVSAYKDNVAFIQGPVVKQFAPLLGDQPSYFVQKDFQSVLSLKAETHNFPTTVEPFNGAATGTGGEIRDRMAGGKGSIPLAGTAVYMTSYPRLDKNRIFENYFEERKWLYHSPLEILIRASDGASDFGNKFGQPLINGSLFTFEYFDKHLSLGYDKVIMQAGGVGYGKESDCKKESLQKGDAIILLGGDNYRIGMGGAAVSSVATGQFQNAIELNAVQRSNPEMQKRVMNAIRAAVEADTNTIISIHDHGAGGHLNCFSELLEETGGRLIIDNLPAGDPTLSDKEIISNESQERMGLALHAGDTAVFKRIASREQAPFYEVGEATGDHLFVFENKKKNVSPVHLKMNHLFGSSPPFVIRDEKVDVQWEALCYDENRFEFYLEQVLQLESVACKDWLTNKVDRSVSGRVAMQQACGSLQLPLNNAGIMALDFESMNGIATALGHAPGATLIDAGVGSKLAVVEALLNLIWAPLTYGLKGVSLSANWMWPCKARGENVRLYEAVQAVSDFACQLGINIPTGKDSLSMTQKYGDQQVHSPGTVIITAVGEVTNFTKAISPALKKVEGSKLIYIDFSGDDFHLGGAFAQVLGQVGKCVPVVKSTALFIQTFEIIQELIKEGKVMAGHDVSAGGLITTLLEMCFPNNGMGMKIKLENLSPAIFSLFSEKPAIVIQVDDDAIVSYLKSKGIPAIEIGEVVSGDILSVGAYSLSIPYLRDKWFHTSYLLDEKQRPPVHAKKRKENIFRQELVYQFPAGFSGKRPAAHLSSKPRAAVIRDKGVNGDRELAYAFYMAGFEVKDVHVTDLIQGREDLSEVSVVAFAGGFSNSDVLGSAKGWAGSLLYNKKAKAALDNFYARKDTLSIGVCNGCQLMMELGLVMDMEMSKHPKMKHNGSEKFESSFTLLKIPANNSIMLGSLAGAQLGAWVAHGEGRFDLKNYSGYQIAATYAYTEYPGNPNDSDFSVAALCSGDGRHLVIMPHLERSLFPWNWPHYPDRQDEVSPWVEAFVNAGRWLEVNSEN